MVHIYKLLRTLIADFSPLSYVDEHGQAQQVDWKYLVALQDLQQKFSIRAANKLSWQHIYFEVKLYVSYYSSISSKHLGMPNR